jgi:catechol 2,3-dioxygenase-like lactoylglutathione lyase family enzyme
MQMPQSPKSFSTIGWAIVVSDLERSTRFYCEGLGFVQGETRQRGDEIAPMVELPSCKLRIRYLGRSDTRIELVEFEEPAPIGERTRKPSNRLGPHMLGFTCEHPHAAAAKLIELGGTHVLNGKAAGGRFDMVTVTDPDGLRIELVGTTIDMIEPLFGSSARG